MTEATRMSTQVRPDDEGASATLEIPSGLSRRGLLQAAAGGMALAASGLLLSARLEDVAARPGAAGGALGGRHGKNRRGRDKSRQQAGNWKPPRGGGSGRGSASPSPPGIAIAVDYEVEEGSTHTEFWTVRTGTWVREQSFSIAPGDHASFQTKWPEAAAWLADRFFVGVNTRSDLPTVTLGHGGSFGSKGWIGGTIVVDSVPLEWSQKTPAMELEDTLIQVSHTLDKDNIAQFVLTFEK
jgi:hypothetical protein